MTNRIGVALERLAMKYSGSKYTIGPSVFRVISGLAMLSEILLVYSERRVLFGPDGVVPFEEFIESRRQFSIFMFSPSTLAFELAYHAAIIIALLWTLGVATRWLTPCLAVCWTSVMDRGPGLWDGGDNLIAILVIYACFADVGAHFSLFRSRAGVSAQRSPAFGILHNTALAAFAVQVSIVYFFAGLLKAGGHTWLDGAALYNSMADREFGWPGAAEFLSRNRVLLSIVGPGTVFFQISFPFFFFLNRTSRHVILVVAIAFHIGIAVFLGLIPFAAFFIAAELALIEDDVYRRVARSLAAALGRLGVAQGRQVGRFLRPVGGVSGWRDGG
jgi:hypothetical protein